MPAPISLLLLVPTRADDHVELLGEQQVDHRGRGLRIVGQIAVGHDVNVGIDVSEHAADNMALALLTLAPDEGAGLGSDLARPVAAIVVVNVDDRAGQRRAESGDRRRDRRFLIVAGQQNGDFRRFTLWH